MTLLYMEGPLHDDWLKFVFGSDAVERAGGLSRNDSQDALIGGGEGGAVMDCGLLAGVHFIVYLDFSVIPDDIESRAERK